MSESLASLRRKIASCDDLQSVVRTMKALAASSIGQYERSVLALGDYYRSVELGLRTCLRETDLGALHATKDASDGAPRIGGVVFGSDQGLVGQFNEVIVDYAVETLAKLSDTVRTWAVGERAHARLTDAGMTPEEHLPVPVSIDAITPLVRRVLLQSEQLQHQGQLTELHIFYNRPTSGAGYAPIRQRLLPIDEHWLRQLIEIPWPTSQPAEVIGDRDASLHTFIHEFLFISLFRACTESLASENASRLAAMTRADKNIDELLEHLYESFHRLRQSGIDEELFDVVSGFEALTDRPDVRRR